MIPLPERHVAALQSLRAVWDAERFIVIGAAAIACHLDLRWRGTVDLDVSVAAGPEDYTRDLERLGWRRETGVQQRWIVPDGSIVDVLPGGPDLVSRGGFTWPDGSARMNLVGLRIAFADAVPVELSQGASVRVASLRSLVVLKIAAYLDQPWERDSDLADIAHILSEYLAPDADERWSDEIINAGMDYEDVSPFALGKQLGALVDEAERGLITGFLAALDDPGDRLNTLPRMAQRAPVSWKNPDRLRLRLAAFRRGFES